MLIPAFRGLSVETGLLQQKELKRQQNPVLPYSRFPTVIHVMLQSTIHYNGGGGFEIKGPFKVKVR